MSGYQGNGGRFQYQQDEQNRFTQLRADNAEFVPRFAPPGIAPPSINNYNGSRGFMSQTPASAAQFDGNSGLNPSSSRYVPPQRRNNYDPIARPESSMSNATFATQMPGGVGLPYSPFQEPSRPARPMPGGQRGYGQHYNDFNSSYGGGAGGGFNSAGMGGLGAGLSNLCLNEFQSQLALQPVDERSDRSSQRSNEPLRNDSFALAGGKSARALAHEVMSGYTEDPYDRSLNRYDTSEKLPVPSLGPARFKESKMFTTLAPDTGTPDVALTTNQAQTCWVITPKQAPEWLDLAIRGECKPSLNEAYDALPMLELGREIAPSKAGVIRVKDIPYATTRQEMTAFVGRNTQVLRQPEGSPYHAVHIMMERESGKTMDCFIEFATPNEAAWVCRQFARRVEAGRSAKVGDREVQVTYSSQDEFLSELFPRAKHTRFSGGQPVIDKSVRTYYENVPAAGFKGFMHTEEFVMLVKHATLSERSPFASKSPCRVYEHMITTLYKYPWYAVEVITVRERRAIYDCTASLIRILIEQLRRANGRYNPLEPTPALLQELVIAALTCPGFSEKQKHTIVFQLNQHGYKSIADGACVNVALGGHHEFSGIWPFASLGVIPGTDRKLLHYYASLFRKATESSPQKSGSLASRKTAQAAGGDQPLGNFKIKYPNQPDELPLAKVAEIEYAEIEKALQAALPMPASPVFSVQGGVGGRGPGSSSGSSHHTVRSLN